MEESEASESMSERGRFLWARTRWFSMSLSAIEVVNIFEPVARVGEEVD